MAILGLLAGLLVLPPYLIYHTFRYLIRGPSHPVWSLPLDLFCTSARFLSSCSGASGTSHPTPLKETGPRGAYDDAAFEQPAIARWTVGRGIRVGPVRVPAVSEEWRVGVARVGEDVVKPVDIPGFWVDANQDGAPERPVGKDERVVLYFAGGGLRPLLSPTPYALTRTLRMRILAVSYPSAKSTATAFPAQLLDALAGWQYLTQTCGAVPTNVLLMGESAGAFAALALVRYLGEMRKEGRALGVPGGVALISPACNMSRLDHPVIETDFRLPHYRRHIAPALAHHFLKHPLSPPLSLHTIQDDVYLSPSLAPPGSFAFLKEAGIKMWVQWGSGELFSDDVSKLVERMKEDGVQVGRDEVPGGLHCQATMALSIGSRGRAWNGIVRAVEEMGWSMRNAQDQDMGVDTKSVHQENVH